MEQECVLLLEMFVINLLLKIALHSHASYCRIVVKLFAWFSILPVWKTNKKQERKTNNTQIHAHGMWALENMLKFIEF